jgi:excisionase family DNA binding protein
MPAPAPDLHLLRPDAWPAFLTLEEVAKILRVARSSAYEMAASGALPTVRFSGRSLRVPRGVLARLAGELPVRNDGEFVASQGTQPGGGIEGHALEES